MCESHLRDGKMVKPSFYNGRIAIFSDPIARTIGLGAPTPHNGAFVFLVENSKCSARCVRTHLLRS